MRYMMHHPLQKLREGLHCLGVVLERRARRSGFVLRLSGRRLTQTKEIKLVVKTRKNDSNKAFNQAVARTAPRALPAVGGLEARSRPGDHVAANDDRPMVVWDSSRQNENCGPEKVLRYANGLLRLCRWSEGGLGAWHRRWRSAITQQIRCVFFTHANYQTHQTSKKGLCPNPYNHRNPHLRKISQEQQPLSSVQC